MTDAGLPVLPDDPHEGEVGHLLVVDRRRDVWWRVHHDGTRSLVGSRGAADELVRTWLACRPPFVIGQVTECVVARYTVRFLGDPRELHRWPDTTPAKEIR